MSACRLARALVLALLISSPAAGQVATGFPPFASLSGGPDIVNNANGNVHITIPIFSRAGRGIPYSYALQYDSSVWSPYGASGFYGAWVPSISLPLGLGWTTYSTASAGEYNFTQVQECCPGQHCNPDLGTGTYYNKYSGWQYIDGNHTPHSFAMNVNDSSQLCPYGIGSWSATGATGDGSGLTMTVDATPEATFVYDIHGTTFDLQNGVVKDRNGNELSGSGDTLGTIPLTISTSGNPVTFTYTSPSGQQATVKVYYQVFTVRSNFGCNGVTEYPPTSQAIVTEIDLPDYNATTNPNARYTFAYEPTPGYSGDVTGRLASVTLPTGGQITYAYSGGNNGIMCADGSVATLTRTTPDGTWTYARSGGTLITDPQGNQTNMSFQGIYETERQIYQGPVSPNNLRLTVFSCYNGATPPCTGSFSTITQKSVYTQWPSNLESETNVFYNGLGLPTEEDDYDYGSGSPGGLLRKTLISYASLGNYIADKPASVTVQNGSSTTVAQTNYTYDQGSVQSTSGTPQHVAVSGSRGNVTTVQQLVQGTTFLTGTIAYYDTGNIYTATGVNAAVTTFNYANSNSTCGNSFPTSVSEPLNMSRSMTWNCTGGVQLTSTDENGQAATYNFSDLYYWRPASVSYPDGGLTSWTYNSPTSVTTTTKMNSSQNIASTVLLDGLGRSSETELTTDPLGTDYSAWTYDSLGRPYQAYNATRCNPPTTNCGEPTWGYTTQAYDALSRPTKVTLQDGSFASASYTNNTTTFTDPAGKIRTATFDALGRLTQVFEDPGSSPHLNFETDYAYDALGNLLCVGQKGTTGGTWSGCGSIPSGWRARSYSYDAISRLTSETNPESGTTNYKLDSDPNCASPNSSPGDLVSRTDARGIRSCFQYDARHRVTQKSYSDGTTATAWFSYDSGGGWGITQNNVIGRMAEAWTGTSCCVIGAAEIFGYDSMGRIVLNNQRTPIDAPTAGAPISYTYDLAGDLTSYTTGVGVTFTQTLDSAARPTGLTSSYVDSQHPATLASTDPSVGYYPFGALRKMNLGNNLTETAAFNNDLQTCRININSSATALGTCADAIPSGNIQDYNYGFNLGSSDNGTIVSWAGTGQQSFNRTYTYDALSRLSTFSSPSDPGGCTGLSWVYDAWANRTQQNNTGGTCPTFSQTVNAQNQLIGPPYVYDAAGNMIQDESHTYFYDAENRLTQVDGTLGSCSTATACYTYDALGRRVESAVGSTTTDYLYDLSGSVVTDMNNVCGSPCWAASYIYMNGALAAEYKNSTTYFVEPDHLGSTRIVTGMGQSVVEALDYLPFGELNSSDPGYTTHEFTGDQHDSEASLDHTWFRKYSPAMAHWMTPDPSGLAAVDASNPQSWNRYTYALNDPCALVDPLGLDTCKFNIGVYANQLSQTQLKALQNSLAAIFNAAGVGVNFSFSGNADFSFSVVPSGTPVGYQINGPSGSNGPLYAPAIALGSDSGFNPSTNTAAANHGVGFFDGVFGFYGISATSTEVGSILGRIGAHEAGHYLLNMLHNTPFQSLYGHLMDQNVNLQDPTVSFTPNQATQLQHRCEKLHGNGPGSAGGGGSAGGPANGGGGFIWVWAHISCTYLGTGSWACTTTYTPVL